jgi:hypothetical protein
LLIAVSSQMGNIGRLDTALFIDVVDAKIVFVAWRGGDELVKSTTFSFLVGGGGLTGKRGGSCAGGCSTEGSSPCVVSVKQWFD